MQRRNFIATMASLSTLGACSTASNNAREGIVAADPGEALLASLTELLTWLAATPWQSYLGSSLGVVLPASGNAETMTALLAQFDDSTLRQIRAQCGFEDFGGKRLLEPGKPALSLLYFALASPRVRLPGEVKPLDYPSIDQIDTLEDLIYATDRVSAVQFDKNDYVLAVFAYEFRPAAKTPHRQHADMVFSRTGVSRVGTRPHRWNRVRRCFDSLPEENPGQALTPQDVAVTPARFGLFLAQVVRRNGLNLQVGESRDFAQFFLLPVRKLVNGDPLIGASAIVFSQYHRDEKLHRLVTMEGRDWKRLALPARIPFACQAPPFLRVTSTSTAAPHTPLTGDNTFGTAQQLVGLLPLRSSSLLLPVPAPLVREAVQRVDGREERLRFRVPPHQVFHGQGGLSNRRYTTLKLIENPALEAGAFGMDDIVFGGGRPTTSFIAPRNGPTFVNIRYMVTENDGSAPVHLGPGCGVDYWEDLIRSGGYWAALFQDNLCDGCVSAKLASGTPGADNTSFVKQLSLLEVLPAFSLVAAPDFMQLIDGRDLRNHHEHFLEGGPETVSGARVRANPHLRIPGTERQAFLSPFDPVSFDKTRTILARKTALTITALVSDTAVRSGKQTFAVDYEASNSLPDTASNVFAPGWDVTYSTAGSKPGPLPYYFASFGLGSPFPEDMKLCAAANGMWPAASPDASRTYYPSLGEVITSLVQPRRRSRRPPTAVPFLDDEIGHHPASHAVLEKIVPAGTGWDGEYGPFLTRLKGSDGRAGRLAINFTNIGHADYVHNALSSNRQMRMRSLQHLTAEQVIARMDALRICISRLPGASKVRMSTLWLVSAEAVPNWSVGALGSGIPLGLLGGTDKTWAQRSRFGPEARDGYLFVFASRLDKSIQACPDDASRAVVACATMYVCQLARKPGASGFALAWTALQDDTPSPATAAWKVHDYTA